MKKILCLIIVLCVTSCVTMSKREEETKFIWRETSAIPLNQVETPRQFRLSPRDATAMLMHTYKPPRTEWYIFADSTYYYCGYVKSGSELPSPKHVYWIINGNNGKWLGKNLEYRYDKD